MEFETCATFHAKLSPRRVFVLTVLTPHAAHSLMNSIVFEQVSFVGSMASTAAHCPVSPSSTRKREVHN